MTLRRHTLPLAQLDLSYVERNPELRDSGPTLLFAHATGFHARAWDQVISHLPPVHSICVDLRGHGHSTGGPIAHWNLLGQDLLDLVTELDLKTIVSVGHSIGGHALTQASADMPSRLSALVLVDAVIMAPEYYALADHFYPKGAQHPAAQRKKNFSSVEEMIARFKERTPYSLFTQAALRDYCTHGLLQPPQGDGLTLACTPETEASAYIAALTNGAILDCPARIACPVTILRADPMDLSSVSDFTRSPTWPELAAQFPNATDISRPDLSHFMPMQDPGFVAEHIARAAQLDHVQPA